MHLLQALFEQQPQAQRDISVFSGILRGAVYGHAVKGYCRLATARHLFEGDGLVAQMALRQFVHSVADVTAFNDIG